jgi:hypothetical protein
MVDRFVEDMMRAFVVAESELEGCDYVVKGMNSTTKKPSAFWGRVLVAIQYMV